MGIKTIRYKANSIVYFQGDEPKRVFILKKGSIVTKTKDIKTNEDILTMIKVGEFIGVKNVISNQPYSETVSTLTDSELVVFSKEDFEAFIMGNNRVMMQTLVVFSNQLRKIHNDIKELTGTKDIEKSHESQEDKLFDLGKFFLTQNRPENAAYCFEKYKKLYPNGKHVDEIGDVSSLKNSTNSANPNTNIDSLEGDEAALYFQEGQNYLDEENFQKASECFLKVIGSGKYKLVDATFYNGVCLYNLKKFKGCINNFSSFLSKNRDYPKIDDVMFYVGSSYKNIGDSNQGDKFLKMVMKNAEGTPLAQMAHQELKG